jgi:anti-sigma-K factor RskA
MESEKQKLLQRYLDGELSAENERQVLHLIADDPELRAMVRFDRELHLGLINTDRSDFSSYEVPDGFTDSVMSAIEAESAAGATNGIVDRLNDWLNSIWQPRPVRIRPAYVAVAALLLAVIIGLPFGTETEPMQQGQQTAMQTVSDTEEQVWVRFVYVKEDAQSVAVAGDFNDWEPTSLSSQTVNGEEVWTGFVALPRGEHRYMFVVDGEEWVTDPLAEAQREDGFGNKNAVIYL